jgi:hypothetical protein
MKFTTPLNVITGLLELELQALDRRQGAMRI